MTRTISFRLACGLRCGWMALLGLVPGLLAAAESFHPREADPMLEPWRWRSYPELSGLGATCVLQAPDGVMWFGTNDVIWSYDGLTWKKHEDLRFHNGAVESLAVEPDGGLLAAGSWGLQRFKAGRWEWLLQRTGQQFGDCRKAVVAPDGTIWVATLWGLLEMNGGRRRLHTSPAQAARAPVDATVSPLEIVPIPASVGAKVSASGRAGELALSDVALDGAGGVWLVADEGEVLHHVPGGDGGGWRVFTAADGLKPGRRPSILRRREGDIWVVYGVDSGHLNVFDGRQWTARSLAAEGVPGDCGNLLQTWDGTVWLSARYVVAAWRGGRWQRYEKPAVPIPNVANFVGEGIDGALWIGGSGTEIQRVDYATGRWRTLLDLMFQWEGPDGTEWFLHRDGRVVTHRDGRWTSYGEADGVPDAPVALIGTQSGEVWVAGSHRGEAAMARHRDGLGWERTVQPEFAWGVDWRGVLEAADGSVWFAATVDSRAPERHRAGLLQFRDGRWIHHHQPGRAPTGADDSDPATLLPATQRPEPVGKFAAVGESPAGRIWAGRNLLVVHDGRTWERAAAPAGLNFGQIDTLFTTRERELWLGSRQFGAFRFDGREWRSYQQKGGLVANSIRGFAQTDDGTVWVATGRDISRFDGRTWTSAFFPGRFVPPHDGGSLRAGRGSRIWVNRFPSEWMTRAWARAPVVKERPVDDEFWTVRHAYGGPPPETALTLAPTRISPPGNLSVSWRGQSPWRGEEARLQFAHRLDGGPWSEFKAETGHAFFELPPGPHRLEVVARDRDFNLDPTPAVLEFVVLPPVWRQGWFVALIAVLGGALGGLTIRLARQQLRLRRVNRELAAEIAEHRRAEQARVASEERFRELAETIDEVFWMIDTESGRVLYVSPAYERIWGRSCAELYADARAWSDAVVPEDRPRVLAAFGPQASGNHQDEYRILRPDGTVRWIGDRSFPVRGPDGAVTKIVGVARDITERKEAQEELRSREEYFQNLIEHSSDLIAVLTRGGQIRYRSPAASRVLRRLADAPVSRSIYEWIHPDDQVAVREAIERAAGSEEPVSVEFRVRTEDGRWRVLQALGRRLSGQGADTLVVVNGRDVTEMQELERQFRQAQKMEALGQLAGGVAHDFNNLLTVIAGNACLLQSAGGLAGEGAELVRDIRGAAERAAGLTRQLLMFSRREKALMREVELGQLIANLGNLLRRLISEEVTIEIATQAEPLWLRADPGMLEQVVLNLAINARDAMPGGGRLTIRTRLATGGEVVPATAVLEVEDTGTGIAPEILPKIFEPFFTTKDVGKGTGLGLATVFGIVQQHQGRVEVESPPGGGAIFRVFLPLAAGAADPGAGEAPKAARGRGELILLAEDEPSVRDVGLRALTAHGYRVLAAESGQAALEAWSRHRDEIALLLTDMIMPGGMTGVELARRLRADRPDLRVIFSSGYSRDTNWEEVEVADADRLPKPYTLELLFETVRTVLDRPCGPDALRPE